MILLTGANGFLGSSILGRILKRPEQIVAVDLQEEIIRVNAPDGCLYLNGSINDLEFISRLKNEFHFTSVIHCAALIAKNEGKEDVQRLMAVNVDGTANITEIAAAHGARIIFPSTAMVYGDNGTPFAETMQKNPSNSYAVSKHLAEEIIMESSKIYGFDYAIARIAVLYGPGQGGDMFIPAAVKSLADGKSFPMTSGEQERDFIHVEDLLDLFEIFLSCAEVRGVFNAGTGNPETLAKAALLIREACGTEAMPVFGAIPYRPNELWKYSVDPFLAKARFGWFPSVKFSDGIKGVVEHYKKGIEQ